MKFTTELTPNSCRDYLGREGGEDLGATCFAHGDIQRFFPFATTWPLQSRSHFGDYPGVDGGLWVRPAFQYDFLNFAPVFGELASAKQVALWPLGSEGPKNVEK